MFQNFLLVLLLVLVLEI